MSCVGAHLNILVVLRAACCVLCAVCCCAVAVLPVCADMGHQQVTQAESTTDSSSRE